MVRYSVVTVHMLSGERMPMLIDSETGLGTFEPNIYALHLRARNLAANTIGQALRSVQLLYQILEANKINLIERIKNNSLLTLSEIEALVEQCKLKKQDLNEVHFGPLDEKISRLDIAKLKKGRKAIAQFEQVDKRTSLVRLKYVTGYVKWLVEYAYLQNMPNDREIFDLVGQKTVQALKVRAPKVSQRRTANRKRGWTKDEEAQIMALVNPVGERNPWRDKFLRERNYLMLGFLLATGVRKGELLGIKISDLNFGEGTVFIARRADDPEDPRTRAPTQKTYDRVLSIGVDLVQQLKDYLQRRANITAARKHPYLFVTETGAPMALNTVDHLFNILRKHLPKIQQLSAHICRHTWNDRFSELFDEKLNDAEAKKIRNYLMGWSSTSRSDENYTVRHVEKQAHKALIEMQKKLYKGVV